MDFIHNLAADTTIMAPPYHSQATDRFDVSFYLSRLVRLTKG